MFNSTKQMIMGTILCLYSALSFGQNTNTGVCLNPEETELTILVNQFRAENGLPPISTSYWLTSVGQWHVWDLVTNNPVGGTCNIHSWSNAMPSLWSSVCYNGSSGTHMWNKPRQISSNVYNSNGYENAAVSGTIINAQTAITLWKNSQVHRDVILNQGVWAGQTWRGLGVGIYNNYAVLWFGTLTDPNGSMTPCVPISDEIFKNGFE